MLSLLKYERIRFKTSDGLKKNHILGLLSQQRTKIIKVILLFTRSYFKKDNPPMSEKERGVKVYTAGEMYLEVSVCVKQLKRQDFFSFFVGFVFFV